VIDPTFDPRSLVDWFQVLSTPVSALATVILAIITAVYVRLTGRLAKAAEVQILEAALAWQKRYNTLELAIEDIRHALDPSHPYRLGSISSESIDAFRGLVVEFLPSAREGTELRAALEAIRKLAPTEAEIMYPLQALQEQPAKERDRYRQTILAILSKIEAEMVRMYDLRDKFTRSQLRRR
jgi:hypothetical protein